MYIHVDKQKTDTIAVIMMLFHDFYVCEHDNYDIVLCNIYICLIYMQKNAS